MKNVTEITFDRDDIALLYESVRMYRDEFSVYLQGLRQTEPQFQASTIALAKIEGLLTRLDREVQRAVGSEQHSGS